MATDSASHCNWYCCYLLDYVVKTYIHVNQHVIRSNKKNRTNEPVITVKKGSKNTYCHKVKILGPSEVVYSGNDKPLLSCGARVAVVTESEVEIVE
jgi:hypothetical protein